MDMQVAETELLDIVSVGRSLPGTMIGNVAYLFGFRRCGKGRSPARSVTRCARGPASCPPCLRGTARSLSSWARPPDC